jgi:voltage-gated potassium channel
MDQSATAPAEKPAAPDNSPLGATIVDDLVMIALAAVSVLLLCFEIVADQTPEQMAVLETVDALICAIFLGEFCVRFAKAPDRRVFVRRHWWELLAAIPINSYTTQLLRGVNLLRMVRLVRLLRLIRFVVRLKILLDNSARFAEKTYLVYVATLAAAVIAFGTLGFHYMEAGHNPNVKSLWDSFWWTIVTITTVGYGDIYPVTTGGRILAIFLMIGGITTFSASTAAIAAHLIRQDNNC